MSVLELKNDISRSLLEIGAVDVRVNPPFTWASGRLAPIYCDNRLIMSYPKIRKKVSEGFKMLINAMAWEPAVIAGTSTAGIPHAAWLADLLDLPMVYVRSSEKQHGKGGRIEGKLGIDQPVILIEDLISTGGSSVSAANAIIHAGANLLCVYAIFTYRLDIAFERFHNAGIPFDALTNLDILKRQAVDSGRLSSGSLWVLNEWRKNPSRWSSERGGAS